MASEHTGGPLDTLLCVGRCEPLKAGVHGVLMAVAALCAAYNAAAWIKRRERHLALNTVLYGATVLWELNHVQEHVACYPPAADEEREERPAA